MQAADAKAEKVPEAATPDAETEANAQTEPASASVGGQCLLHLGLRHGLGPVDRRHVQHAVFRPARQQAKQVAHIPQGLDPVHAAARQQRHEDGCPTSTRSLLDRQGGAYRNHPSTPSHRFTFQQHARATQAASKLSNRKNSHEVGGHHGGLHVLDEEATW